MIKHAGIAGGVALGAALMYFLDPNRGKQRRRNLRDQAADLANAGVKEIHSQLEVRRVPKFLQSNWTPTVKAIVGTAGGAMAAYALSQTVGGRRVLNGVRDFPPIHR